LIDKIEKRRQSFFMPKFELFVAASIKETLKVFIRDTVAIQVDRLNAHEISFNKLRIRIGGAARGVRLLCKLAKKDTASGDERHAFVELPNRPHDVHLRQMLLGFRTQEKCVAPSGE